MRACGDVAGSQKGLKENMPDRVKNFVVHHRIMVRRVYFVGLLALAIVGGYLIYYFENLGIWRTLFSAMSKWQMMLFIVVANGVVFVLLVVSLRLTHWLHGDDDLE